MESSSQESIHDKELEKSNQDDLISGFAFGLAAMICGVLLLSLPEYFKYEMLTKGISYVLIFGGMFSVGSDLNKLNGDKTTLGVDDFTLGIAFISFSIFVHSYFSNFFVNCIVALIFFFGVFGTIKGVIHFVSGIFKAQNKNDAWIKALITFLSFVTALITVYEALKKVGIIEK